MKALAFLCLLLLVGSVSAHATYDMPANTSFFPIDFYANTPIDNTTRFPAHASNTAYMANLASQNGGTYPYLYSYDGSPGGFYINVVNNSTEQHPTVAFTLYSIYADDVPYPIPPNVVYENGSSDHHMCLYDPNESVLWELYGAAYVPATSSWTAACGVRFDLTSYTARPMNWTGTNAGGTSECIGIIREDEVETKGEINHAINIGIGLSMSGQQVFPAVHTSAKSGGVIPAGSRLRLKSSFDTSGYSNSTKVVLNAMKKYGMIVMDSTGQPTFVAVLKDPKASYGSLGGILVNPTNFEFIDQSNYTIYWGTTTGTRYSWQVKQEPGGTPPPDPPYPDPLEGWQPTNISGAAPLTVNFTDYSYDNPNNTTYWTYSYKDVTGANTWVDFGYNRSVNYTFTTAGNYSIRLVAGNEYGENTTPNATYTNFVNVSTTGTVANFTKSKSVVRIPSTINFNSTSTNASYWNWSFGDATYGYTENITHRYTRPGIFNVSLTTTNAEGLGSDIHYDTVRAVRGGASYEFYPGNEPTLFVNCEEGTYMLSREVTESERIMTEDKIFEVCL